MNKQVNVHDASRVKSRSVNQSLLVVVVWVRVTDGEPDSRDCCRPRICVLLCLLIKPGKPIRSNSLVFANINFTKSNVGMRLEESLQVSLSFHAGPVRDLIKFIVRDAHHGPTLSFQKTIFQCGMAQCARVNLGTGVVVGLASEMQGAVKFKS